MVVLSVALPSALHRRLAIAGLDRNIAMNEMIRRAVAEYLDRSAETPSRRKGGR